MYFFYSILANFGGVFGLCLGGSFISLVEIVYLLLTRGFNTILIQLLYRQKQRARNQSVFTISNAFRLRKSYRTEG